MSTRHSMPIFHVPLRALRFVRHCGASQRSLFSMLALSIGKAGLDAMSALLLASTLALLLPFGHPPGSGYLQLQALSNERLGGVFSPVVLLVMALVISKGVLTPLLLSLRGRIVDQWTLLLSMHTFAKELQVRSAQRQVNAQGMNVSLNFTVPRLVSGAVLPSLDLMTEVTLVTVLLAVLMMLQPAATSILIAALFVASCVSQLVSRYLLVKQVDVRMRLQALMLRWVTDGAACLRELRLYRRIPAVLERYRPVAEGYAKANAQERTFLEVQSPAMELFFLLLLGLAVFIASESAWQAKAPVLALFSAVGLRLIVGFKRIAGIVQTLGFVRPALEQLSSAQIDEISERPILPAQSEGEVQYFVRCESLHYRHRGASEDIIRNLNFAIQKGEWVGLIGESGVGKSTFVDLLIGELQPHNGRLQWAAGDPAYAGIGYAGAVTTLIPGSLRDNLAFLAGDRCDLVLLDALRIASIESLLDRLPEGLDTAIETFEQRLSSGERQRLGLARALLQARSVLILDEATASLDQVTERRFLHRLRESRPDLAVLLITHRLSVLRFTERQLVMIDGALQRFTPESTSDQLPGIAEQKNTCI